MKIKRKTDGYGLAALITLLIIGAGMGLGEATVSVFNVTADTDPAAYTFLLYFSFAGVWAALLTYLLLAKGERPLLMAMSGKIMGNSLKNIVIGLLLGAALNGFCALIAIAHGDIHLSFTSFDILPVLFIAFAVAVQSGAEEAVCRCFFYRHLRRGYKHPAVAVAGNALLFALLHIPNNGATVLSTFNVLLVGIFFSLMVFYFDSLWMAAAAHTSWNFTQNILLGLPNSGIKPAYSIFRLDTSTLRDTFAYNTAFGIEGTWVANIVLSAAIIAIIVIGEKHGVRETNIWEPAGAQTPPAA